MNQILNKNFRARFIRDFKLNWMCYLMFLPTIAYYIIFSYMPIYGICIAFLEYRPAIPFFEAKFVGLENFVSYFSGMFFLRNLKNTLMLTSLSLIIEFPIPIIFALLLNEITNVRFKKVVQNITYLPHFVSIVVICGILQIFVKTDGVFNKIIALFNPNWTPVNLLSRTSWFRPLYIGSGIWQGFGWGSILYLSALSGIDAELYEAALMDGASRWKQTIHITIPGIMPTICLMLILKCGGMLSTGSEKIILLYNPAIYSVADTLDTYIFREGIQGADFSGTAAVGMAIQAVSLAIMMCVNKITKKLSGNGLF